MAMDPLKTPASGAATPKNNFWCGYARITAVIRGVTSRNTAGLQAENSEMNDACTQGSVRCGELNRSLLDDSWDALEASDCHDATFFHHAER
jgi:hypothetical protein